MNARLLLSVVLAFSLVLAGCGVQPGLSEDADHTFIVSSDAFHQAISALRADGIVVNVIEPLFYDASAGIAAFTTSEGGVFVHATVRIDVVAAVVVLAFDDDGGWVFTDSVSGVRAAADMDALARLAGSSDLSTMAASSDVALAYALLEVFGFGGVDVVEDGVHVLCAACSRQQGRLNEAQGALALATVLYAQSFKAFATCFLPPACALALLWNQANAVALTFALIGLGNATSDLNACRRQNSC